MSFQTNQSVKYLNTGLFQGAGPANVRSFVEARLEFDHDGYFLGLSCFHERSNDG
jgi:hypothetical protein